MILTPKVRKTLDIAIRLGIACLASAYIFYRVYTIPATQLKIFFESVISGNHMAINSAALFLLMLINWGIESLKWKWLMHNSEKISFINAYQAVLGGLAVSVFTPNRVGEFFGRVFILKKTDPIKAILLTIVGSFSQLIVTIVVGTVAYLVFAPQYLSLLITDSEWIVKGFSISLVLISVLLFFIYFNVSVLHRVTILIPEKYSERITRSVNAIADCPRSLLLKIISLSALRYLVFATQLYMAIRLMELTFTPFQCMMVIPVIYLFLASIPTVALTELGVRGSVAVFLFGLLNGNPGLDAEHTLAVVSATTLIWLLNIALPSLAGVLVVFRLKFFGR